jgi:hypothetical protein
MVGFDKSAHVSETDFIEVRHWPRPSLLTRVSEQINGWLDAIRKAASS